MATPRFYLAAVEKSGSGLGMRLLHSYVGTLCTGYTLYYKNCVDLLLILQFQVRQISQWRIQVWQLEGLLSLLLLDPSLSYLPTLRKACRHDFFGFSPNLATASLKPLSLLMMTSPELWVRCVSANMYSLVTHATPIYTNGLITKVIATTKSSLQCWLVTHLDISYNVITQLLVLYYSWPPLYLMDNWQTRRSIHHLKPMHNFQCKIQSYPGTTAGYIRNGWIFGRLVKLWYTQSIPLYTTASEP